MKWFDSMYINRLKDKDPLIEFFERDGSKIKKQRVRMNFRTAGKETKLSPRVLKITKHDSSKFSREF